MGSSGKASASTGDASWTVPTLGNSWANVAGWSTAGFRKDGQGFVHLRGRLAGGADNTSPFTLPAGYRPGSGTAHFGISNADTNDQAASTAAVFISTAGVVTLRATGGVRFPLDGISFYAEN